LAANLPALFASEKGANAAAHNRMVVNDKDAQGKACF